MLGIDVLKRMGGGSAAVVDLNPGIIQSFRSAQWRFASDGYQYTAFDVADTFVQDATWIIPQTGMSLYDIRATLVSGSVPPGPAFGTWHSLSANRTWGWDHTFSNKNAVMKIEIRLNSSGVILDSANYSFELF